MERHSPKNEPHRKPLEAVPLKPSERRRKSPLTVIIENLNVITGPLREIKDPVRRICYEPFLNHYEERYRSKFKPHHARWVYVLDMVLLAIGGALAVAGFLFYFILPAFPTAKTVSLQLLSPQRITSGAPTNLLLTYRNESGAVLTNATLLLTLPEGFMAEQANEAATKETPILPTSNVREFILGDVPINGQGRVAVAGTLFAPIGANRQLTAELYYWPSSATEPRRLNIFYTLPVEDAVLQIGLEASKDIVRGQQCALNLTYANAGVRPLEAVISADLPADFVLTGSRPASVGREWRLGQLQPGERGTIVIFGYFRTNSTNDAANFNIRAETIVNRERLLVQEIRQDLLAQANGFSFHQTVTRPSGLRSLRPGDEFEVTISYGNDGIAVLHDLNIELATEPTGAITAFDGITTWGPDDLPELQELAPGAHGEIVVRLTLRDELNDVIFGTNGPLIDVVSHARYVMESDTSRPFLSESEVITLPIATKLGVKARAAYFTSDGEQLGSGPLPPVIGTTTKYWIIATVSSSTGDVRDARLTCKLAPGVEWTGRYSVTSGEALAHIPTTGQVIWDIGRIPAGADGSGTRVAASFEVAVTPQTDNLGQTLPLVNDITVVGLDNLTDLKMSATALPILTDERAMK